MKTAIFCLFLQLLVSSQQDSSSPLSTEGTESPVTELETVATGETSIDPITKPETSATEISTDHPETTISEVTTDNPVTKPETNPTEVSTDHPETTIAEATTYTPVTEPETNPTELSTDHPKPTVTEVSSDNPVTQPETNPTERSTDNPMTEPETTATGGATDTSVTKPNTNPTGGTTQSPTTVVPPDDCDDFYFWDGSRCVAGIGSDCTLDRDCKAVTNSSCTTGASGTDVCTCDEGLYGKLDYSQCLERTEENDDGEWPCTNDDNCGFIIDDAINGTATCNKDSICECSQDDWFIHDVTDMTYIKCARMLGAECEVDEQCNEAIQDSVCDGTCVCDSDYEEDGSKTECKKSDSGASSVAATAIIVYLTAMSARLMVA